MARVLATAVPRFLLQLSRDYAAWVAGDPGQRAAASSEGDLLGGVEQQPGAEAGGAGEEEQVELPGSSSGAAAAQPR